MSIEVEHLKEINTVIKHKRNHYQHRTMRIYHHFILSIHQ